MIRLNSLVRLNTAAMTDVEAMKYPSFFHDGSVVVFMGEISNMSGYGIFLCKNHHYIGYDISLFRELNEDEVLKLKD